MIHEGNEHDIRVAFMRWWNIFIQLLLQQPLLLRNSCNYFTYQMKNNENPAWYFFSESIFFSNAGCDSEGKKLMKQLGIDEQLASLTSVPPTKSALDIWQVGDQHGI